MGALGGGGGGGSTDIQDITRGTVRPWQQFYTNQLNRFGRNQPLLRTAEKGALGFWDQLPGLISQISGLTPNLQSAYGYYGDIIKNRGQLSPEQTRDIQQQTRETAAQYGTGRQLGTLGTELLNRQQAREARLQTAIQGEQGLASSISGLVGQQQGLQTGGLNQLTGVETAKVGNFVPIAQLAQTFPLANLQSEIAQAQIAAQQQIAGQNKAGSTAGGITSALGSVLGAVAMSDERLKKNVKATGLQTKEGIPIKTFEYRANPSKRYAGVVAQDVEKVSPQRVVTDPRSMIKYVVGFPMVEVSAFGKRKKVA
jgi:hypothetical protein